MRKQIIIGLICTMTLISMGSNSFAQTDSQQTEEPIGGTVEFIEQVDDTVGNQVSIQIDEYSIQNLTTVLPYLGIIIAGIIGGIIVLLKKNQREDNEDFENYEDFEVHENDLTSRSKPNTKTFQELNTNSTSDSINEKYLNKIIENKLRIISKLQGSQIGDNDKLEQIKQSLMTDGSFNQKENEYLEEKYEEYKKLSKKDFGE